MELLESLGTVIVPATGRFVASDHFAVNTPDGAEVKIGYVGKNFRSLFLNKVEEPREEMELSYYRLRKTSLNRLTREKFVDESDTTLAAIWELLKLQPHGEDGVFLTDGANVFDVPDINGVLRVMSVHRFCHYDCWNVFAYLDNLSYMWDVGSRFFSRNS